MKLRPYVAADRISVLDLHRELQAYEVPLRPHRSRSSRLSEDYFQHEYDELSQDPDCDCLFLVAEDDGVVIGYVFCLVDEELLDEPREQVQVLDLMVTAAARGRGVGRQLMAAVESFAAERSIARVSLMVLASNEPAVAFYRSLGFGTAILTMERVQTT